MIVIRLWAALSLACLAWGAITIATRPPLASVTNPTNGKPYVLPLPR